jgi:predicted dehydrogenase
VLRVAVVGVGHWGPNLVRKLHQAPSSVVALVVETSPQRRALTRDRFPGINTSAHVEDALKDATIDAVVIATPTHTHFDLAKQALEAGKHVLVEKPISVEREEAEALVALARQHQRILMVGHVFLYNNAIREVKRRLDGGELGALHYISMVRTNLGPIRTDVNAAWDLAAHDIAIANYWLDAEATSASAVGGAFVNAGVEDTVFATLRYPGEILVNLHVSWLNPRKVRNITVVGDKKMLTFDDMNLTEPVRIYDKRVTDERTRADFVDSFASFRASVRDGDITIPQVTLGEPLRAECDAFIDAIVTQQPPLSSGETGVAVVRALAAMRRSMDARGVEVAL